MIEVSKKVIIDGDDYGIFSNILELARRHISTRKKQDRAVDEFTPKEVVIMEKAMERFWE